MNMACSGTEDHNLPRIFTEEKTMAESKTDLFNPNTVELAGFFKALSHPARLSILGVLTRRSNCICADIVEEIPLAQSTISQHLKVLKEVGLIRGEVEGPAVCYCLDHLTYRHMKSEMYLYFNALFPDEDLLE